MKSVLKIFSLVLIFWSIPQVISVVYLDNAICDSNSAVGKITLAYTHDAAGNSVTNVSFVTFVSISKLLVYLTWKIADNSENVGVYRELVKTVFDVGKLLKGGQANLIVKGYFDTILRSLNFTLKFPLPPVSCQILS